MQRPIGRKVLRYVGIIYHDTVGIYRVIYGRMLCIIWSYLTIPLVPVHCYVQRMIGRREVSESTRSIRWYGVASVSRIDKIIGLFCKRALTKRRYSAKVTWSLIDPTDRRHPISINNMCCHTWYVLSFVSFVPSPMKRRLLMHTAPHCNKYCTTLQHKLLKNQGEHVRLSIRESTFAHGSHSIAFYRSYSMTSHSIEHILRPHTL